MRKAVMKALMNSCEEKLTLAASALLLVVVFGYLYLTRCS